MHYFNDGDACIFRVDNYDVPILTKYNHGYIEGESLPDEDCYTSWELQCDPEFQEKERKLQIKVEEFIALFEDEEHLIMFGDHVKVHVTSDEITTDHYDHD